MQTTARRDTPAELRLRSELHRAGLRYRVDRRVLTGTRRRADIVFTAARVAVFVDGCFWHGCPDHGSWPKRNAVWWKEKIESNRRRDADTDARLEAEGWVSVRVWEHEDAGTAAARIVGLVRGRRRT
jgi:DNA mismatch endonuclease (patch repair protein)